VKHILLQEQTNLTKQGLSTSTMAAAELSSAVATTTTTTMKTEGCYRDRFWHLPI